MAWSGRSITHLARKCLQGRHRTTRAKVARFLAVYFTIFFAIAFITPIRNIFAVYMFPKAMLEVSSQQILRMYLYETQYPDYDKPVSCDSVKDKLATVDWEQMVKDMDKFPAYDDTYFLNLLANKDAIGVTSEELAMLRDRYTTFVTPLTTHQQQELRLIFKAFYTAMELFNLTYFFMEGSMLGAYRHHGLVPWDDDFDLVANGTDWFKIKTVLHCLPGFEVDTSTYMMFKFYWSKSARATGVGYDIQFKYPNMDIFLFTEDEDYMWALSRIKKHRILFKKNVIFPLAYRPFDGKMVPVPKDIDTLCTSMYNPKSCVGLDYDHFRNRPLVPFYEYEYVDCDLFKNIYPFVERHDVIIKGKQRRLEVRKLGKKVLSNFTVPL